MQGVGVNEEVELRQDIPELRLHQGQKGVVRSCWTDPYSAYEVEFCGEEEEDRLRVLLSPAQVSRLQTSPHDEDAPLMAG